MTELPHILFRLLYKSCIALITLYTLFIVSNSAENFYARMHFTERSDFQSSPANCIEKFGNIVIQRKCL
jgi:hypothetical protein